MNTFFFEQIGLGACKYIYEMKDMVQRHTLYHIIGCHGQTHLARVAIMGEAIRIHLHSSLPAHAVMIAGMTHDMGRTDDSQDLEHAIKGLEGATRVMLSLEPSDVVFGNPIYGEIIHAIIHHSDNAPGCTELEKILKDADKLDRLRGGDHNLAVSRLELMPSIAFVEEARAFTRGRLELKEWISSQKSE